MQKPRSKFLDNPAHLIVFLPIVVLAAFVAVNYFTFPQEIPARVDAAQNTSQASGQGMSAGLVEAGKLSCPLSFECCNEAEYREKTCPANQACVGNRCEKKECPFGCCDDEGSRAEYKVKECNGNFLCEENKCVQRKCWKECCTGDPAYETKECPGIMVCISNRCEKPACPDKYPCCAGDDSTYSEKGCPGRGVCKFRVCRSG